MIEQDIPLPTTIYYPKFLEYQKRQNLNHFYNKNKPTSTSYMPSSIIK